MQLAGWRVESVSFGLRLNQKAADETDVHAGSQSEGENSFLPWLLVLRGPSVPWMGCTPDWRTSCCVYLPVVAVMLKGGSSRSTFTHSLRIILSRESGFPELHKVSAHREHRRSSPVNMASRNSFKPIW